MTWSVLRVGSASCIDFKAYDICAHTLAVAEMDSSLTEFFKCYKATNQGSPNVDGLINIELPTAHGPKKTQRRRGSVNSNKTRRDVYECYTDTSEPSSSTSGIDHSSVRNQENTEAKTRTKTKTPTSSKGSQVHIPIFGCRNVAPHLIHIGESGKFLKKQPVT